MHMCVHIYARLRTNIDYTNTIIYLDTHTFLGTLRCHSQAIPLPGNHASDVTRNGEFRPGRTADGRLSGVRQFLAWVLMMDEGVRAKAHTWAHLTAAAPHDPELLITTSASPRMPSDARSAKGVPV